MFIPNRWAIVRLRFTGPFAHLELRDQAGVVIKDESSWTTGPEFFIPSNIALPLSRHIARLAKELPLLRTGPHSGDPVPLAVFIDIPRVLWSDTPVFASLS